MRIWLPLVAVVLIASLSLAGLLYSSASPVAAKDRLVILSPHWEGIQHEFERAFELYMKQEHQRVVDIEWLDVGGGSGVIEKYISKQFTALRRVRRKEGLVVDVKRGIRVDILFGGGPDMHGRLSRPATLRTGGKPLALPPLLARYDPPEEILKAIPRQIGGVAIYDAKGHRWFGAALSAFGIIYNKRIVKRARLLTPRDWEDLAAPRVQGWLVSGDPSSSGSVHMVYEIILQAYGFERGYALICRMAGNVRAFNEGGNAGPRMVALGQAAYGMCIDFYGEAQVSHVGDEDLAFILPDGLTVINPDPIAILEGAPNRKLAEHFMAFVLGEPGQKLWMLKRGQPGGPRRFELRRLSVREDLYWLLRLGGKTGAETGIVYNPHTEWSRRSRETRMKPYDSRLGGTRWKVVNALFQSTIITPHDDLKAAWRAIIAAGMPAGALAEFGRAPVTEAELIGLATGARGKGGKSRVKSWRQNEILRAKTSRAWQKFSREKFRRVIGMCREQERTGGQGMRAGGEAEVSQGRRADLSRAGSALR